MSNLNKNCVQQNNSVVFFAGMAYNKGSQPVWKTGLFSSKGAISFGQHRFAGLRPAPHREYGFFFTRSDGYEHRRAGVERHRRHPLCQPARRRHAGARHEPAAGGQAFPPDHRGPEQRRVFGLYPERHPEQDGHPQGDGALHRSGREGLRLPDVQLLPVAQQIGRARRDRHHPEG